MMTYNELTGTSELALYVLPDLLLQTLAYLCSAFVGCQKSFVRVSPRVRYEGINDATKVATLQVVCRIKLGKRSDEKLLFTFIERALSCKTNWSWVLL